MTKWVYLVNNKTQASTEAPDDDGVLEDYARRGWLPAERPGPVPFIPSPDGLGGLKLDPNDYNPAPVSASESEATEPKKVKK